MMSKSFYFKLLRDEARRNIWALALSVLGFLFALPLPVVIQAQSVLDEVGSWGLTEEAALESLRRQLEGFLSGGLPFARAGLMIMAVLCGIVLFRFWHDRRQVDFYCALPVRREALYGVKFSAGVLLVLPAYFAAEVIAIAVAAGFGTDIPWGDMLRCIGTDLCAFFMIYGITILCAVLCGNTLFAAVLDLFLLVSPAVIWQIYTSFAYQCYPAYNTNGVNLNLMSSPLVGFLAGQMEALYSRFLIWYLLVGAAALVLSVVLFCRRHGERAGKALAFAPLGLPLKVYICLVVGIGAACLMAALIGTYRGWLFLFAAVAVAVCHCVVEAVYNAEVRAMFRHLPTLAAVTVVSLLLVAGLKNDVLGYSKWIPKESSVEWVELYNLYCIDEAGSYNIGRYYDFARDERLTDPAVVQAMLELARTGTENLDLKHTNAMSWAESEAVTDRREEINRYYDVTITFGLSGGREASREYTIPTTPETEALVNSILYSEDYLFWHSRVFRFDEAMKKTPERLMEARVADVLRSDTIQTLRDQAQVKSLIEALKADVLAFTPEQAAREGVVLRIRLGSYTEEDPEAIDTINAVAVYPSYQRTLALIEEYTGYVPQPQRADDVESITITDSRREAKEGSQNTCRVNDPEKIAALLENLVCDDQGDRYGMALNMQVSADVYLSNGNYVHMSYPAGKVPEAVLDELFGAPLEQKQGNEVYTAALAEPA